KSIVGRLKPVSRAIWLIFRPWALRRHTRGPPAPGRPPTAVGRPGAPGRTTAAGNAGFSQFADPLRRFRLCRVLGLIRSRRTSRAHHESVAHTAAPTHTRARRAREGAMWSGDPRWRVGRVGRVRKANVNRPKRIEEPDPTPWLHAG